MTNKNVRLITIAGLLSAIGLIIPLVSPFKIVLEPASFTLGSHIPIFIAMFISPVMAVAVSLVTTLGFLISFPPVVAIRALSHVIFAFVGATIIKSSPNLLSSYGKSAIFAIVVSIIHAACEVLVVSFFYFNNDLQDGYYAKSFLFTVLFLVGVGTLVHSIVDFAISYGIWFKLVRAKSVEVI